MASWKITSFLVAEIYLKAQRGGKDGGGLGWSAGVPRHDVGLPGVGRSMQQVGAPGLARCGPVHGGGAGRGAGLLLRAGQRGGRGGGAGGGAAARCHVLAGAAAVEGVPGAEPAVRGGLSTCYCLLLIRESFDVCKHVCKNL